MGLPVNKPRVNRIAQDTKKQEENRRKVFEQVLEDHNRKLAERLEKFKGEKAEKMEIAERIEVKRANQI